mgnify:CR=1 FL=1
MLAMNGWVSAKSSFSLLHYSFHLHLNRLCEQSIYKPTIKTPFVLISVLSDSVYNDLTIFPVDRLGLSDHTTLLVFV